MHGSVYGYAKTTKGKTVAISKRRSSYGKDTLDQLFFQDLTYGRIHSFSDFAKSAAQTPQTFNSFYADAKHRRHLHRPACCRSAPAAPTATCPPTGAASTSGPATWRPSRHPQGTVPNGLLVNWNNKPAPKFSASDDRFGDETMLPRVGDAAQQPRSGRQQHTLARSPAP